jgi:hypothetical protein
MALTMFGVPLPVNPNLLFAGFPLKILHCSEDGRGGIGPIGRIRPIGLMAWPMPAGSKAVTA